MRNDDRISSARAEGTSDSSGNPSAFFFPADGQSYHAIMESLSGRGFTDALSPSTQYILEHVSVDHLLPYLTHVKRHDEVFPPLVKCAHDVLVFDRRFEAILLKYIGVIEMQLKAQYSHWGKSKLGPFFLYQAENYHDPKKHAKSLAGFEREVRRKLRNNKRLRQLYEESDGRLPAGPAIECMTLGTLSTLYDNTKDLTVTSAVCASFHAKKAELSSWLKATSNARNICAHFESLVTRKQIPTPPLPIREVDASNRSPFYITVLLARLLSREELFEDMNLCYPYMLALELYKMLSSFEEFLPGALGTFDIPGDWIDVLDKASSGQVRRAIELLEKG